MTITVGYILHRFPRHTDTFIRREIEMLRQLGTPTEVISVWHPNQDEASPEILKPWKQSTFFLLPASPVKIIAALTKCAIRKPVRLLKTSYMAVRTSPPGLRGHLYQLVYLVQALLAANVAIDRKYTHLHNHIGDQSGTVTMLAAYFADLKFSISYHGWPVFFDAYNTKVKEKVLAASFVRCISYFCRSQLMLLSGATDPAHFKVIHCGLDLDAYPYRPPRKEVKSLFCAARLSPEKGLIFLIEAFHELINRGHDLELKLAGDGPYKSELVELCKRLQISHKVKFLGFLNEAQVKNELDKCDLFVLPSFVEGLPVSAMEAMAIGVPVIATNVGGTSELIEDRIEGVLVKPSNLECLVQEIETLISNFETRSKYSGAGRQKIECEFGLEQEVRKLKGILDDLSK